MAEEWGSGRADITTRANLQIREFQPKNIVRVLNKRAVSGLDVAGLWRRQHSQHYCVAYHRIDPTEL